MKDGKRYTQNRLYEFRVTYETHTDRQGEHYYMCETASHALSSHHGVCMHHNRHLLIRNVYKKNPWSNRWEDETVKNTRLIDKLNKQL